MIVGIILLLCLLILILLDYSLYTRKDSLVAFEVHKTPYDKYKDVQLHDLPAPTCIKMCKSKVCRMYKQQLNRYHLCKECEEERKREKCG